MYEWKFLKSPHKKKKKNGLLTLIVCCRFRRFGSFDRLLSFCFVFLIFPISGRPFRVKNRKHWSQNDTRRGTVHTTHFTGNSNDPCGSQDETVSCRTMSADKKGFCSAKSFYRRTRTHYIHLCSYIYTFTCVYIHIKEERLCIMDLPKTRSIRTGAGVPCANTFRILYWFPVDWNTNQYVCVCLYSNIILSNHHHCTCVRACNNCRRGSPYIGLAPVEWYK